ncbi:MAG: hypothetical protein RL291_2073 [Pseudomonadota bacterium]
MGPKSKFEEFAVSTIPFRTAAVAVALLTAVGIVIAPPLGTSPVKAQQSVEVTFWESVKDSKNPAELQAYLDRYPNGTFAALARLRIDSLRGGGAPTPPPRTTTTPPPQPPRTNNAGLGPNSVLTTRAIIEEVSNILYTLNYSVGEDRSIVTNDLREAIRGWERNTQQPVTGDVTQAQLDRLRSARPPTIWGAVAYSWTGATGTVWNRPDRRTAEVDARKICDEAAGRECSVVATFGNACGVSVHSPGDAGKNSYANGYTRAKMQDATDAALKDCRERAESPNNCAIRTTFCADGSHR